MSFPSTGQSPPDIPGASRRSVVKALTFSLPVAWLMSEGLLASGAYSAVAPSASAPGDFMRTSRLLTGHNEIDDTLADMAWSALVKRDQGFAQAYAKLTAAIKAEGVSDFHKLPQAAFLHQPDLKAATVALVYAWYLGRVGEVQDRSENGPEFVTYTGALMWRPTIDVTVIPTYSRGRPGFWAERPASLSTD